MNIVKILSVLISTLLLYTASSQNYHDFSDEQKVSFFIEDFINNSKGWNLGKFNGTVSKIDDERYHLKASSKLPDQDYKKLDVDFSMNVEVEILARLSDTPKKEEGLFYVYLFTRNKDKVMFGFSSSNKLHLKNSHFLDIKPPIENIDFNHTEFLKLTLRKVNNICYAYINEKLAFEFENHDYTGTIGFMAKNGKTEAEVEYLKVNYLNNKPEIKISTPQITNGSFSSNESQITIEGMIVDDSKIKSLFINNENIAVNFNGMFSHTIDLKEGSQSIKLSVTDVFDAKTDTSLNVYFNDKPKITIFYPSNIKDGLVEINEKRLTVRGTVSDNDGISAMFINNEKIRIGADGSFLTNIETKPGYNNLTFKAIDTKNTTTTTNIVANRNTPPDLKLTKPILSRGFVSSESISIESEPIQKVYTNTSYQEITGRLIDSDGIEYFLINKQSVSINANNEFSHYINLEQGENIVRFEASDKKGSVLNKGLIIVFDEKYVPEEMTKRIALIIGNSKYKNAGSLANPKNDAVAMKIKLKELGFEVYSYLDMNTTKMKAAIDDFGEKLKDSDVGLFFYAGHGIQFNGDNYLVPVNAKLSNSNDVEYECVNAGRILAKMESSQTKTNIIILDACRDNPFERSWSRSTKGKGLANMNAPTGSLLAYATSPGNTASDGNGSNGLYTSALLKHIDTPGITIEDVFKRVRISVMQESENKQTPWETTSLTGDFYFKK